MKFYSDLTTAQPNQGSGHNSQTIEKKERILEWDSATPYHRHAGKCARMLLRQQLNEMKKNLYNSVIFAEVQIRNENRI